jgi:hypothetical protein
MTIEPEERAHISLLAGKLSTENFNFVVDVKGSVAKIFVRENFSRLTFSET